MALVMVYKTPSATPTFTAGATISGTLEAANVLTCAYTVTGSNGEVVRWYRHTADDGSDPTGTLIGEGLTYLLTSNENGFHIRVIVTATNAAGSETSTSAYTGQVTAPPPPEPPSFTSPVTISGTATVGSKLTVQYTPSNWVDVAITWTSYKTEDKQEPVTLGTGPEYTLTLAEDGRWIGVRVVLTNAIGPTEDEDIIPMSGVDPYEPLLPNEYVPPAYDISGMNLVYCNAGDNLQTKLDSLQPGDCLVLEAGATWYGRFSLKNTVFTGLDNKWIYIISSDMANLPAAGERIAPSHSGVTADSATGVFTVPGHGFSNGQKVVFSSLNGGPEIMFGWHYYVGDVTADTFKLYDAPSGGNQITISTDVIDGEIMLAATRMPRIMGIVDNTYSGSTASAYWRLLYIWGGCRKIRMCGVHLQMGYYGTYPRTTQLYIPDLESASSHIGGGSGRLEDFVFDRCYISGQRFTPNRDGMIVNGANRMAILGCHICENHGGGESHGIHLYSSINQITVENNRIEGGGINVFVGGNPTSIIEPEDVVIRGNYLYKPTRWWINSPDYEGAASRWDCKNTFETKGSRKLLFEGNVCHNMWVYTQHGDVIVLTPRGGDVYDTTIRRNLIYNGQAGMNINNADGTLHRVKVEGNVFTKKWGTDDQFIKMASGYDGGLSYVTIDSNTFVSGVTKTGTSWIVFNGDQNTQQGYIFGVRLLNNIADQLTYAIFGNGGAIGPNAMSYWCTEWNVDRNGAFRYVYGQPASTRANWTNWIYSGSSVASVGFVDGTLATLEGHALLPTSPFYGNGIGNANRGADIPALIAAINDRVI